MNQAISLHNVSRETLGLARELAKKHQDPLQHYMDHLLWWNEKVNLVSRDVSRETLHEHLVHSLMPAALKLMEGVESWVDAGTGGGLPGIPLSLTDSSHKWILNDIVQKKMMAVKQIVRTLKLQNIAVNTGSIENLEFGNGTGVISKHAFSVSSLLEMLKGREWERIIMLKGVEEAREELKEYPFSGEAHLYAFEFGDEVPFYMGKGVLILKP